MKTGIELIEKERFEQHAKHGRTIADDIKFNNECQLSLAAHELIKSPEPLYRPLSPNGWSGPIWDKMCNKSYKERLIIAGALIAAELDRLAPLEKNTL